MTAHDVCKPISCAVIDRAYSGTASIQEAPFRSLALQFVHTSESSHAGDAIEGLLLDLRKHDVAEEIGP